MIIKGEADNYRLNKTQEAIDNAAIDEYFIAKLKVSNDGVYINIPVNLLQIMREFFNGRTIEIKEN